MTVSEAAAVVREWLKDVPEVLRVAADPDHDLIEVFCAADGAGAACARLSSRNPSGGRFVHGFLLLTREEPKPKRKKFSVLVTVTTVHRADLDLPPDATPEQVRQACAALTADDFWTDDTAQDTSILDPQGNDVTGDVQPTLPDLTDS